MASRSATEGSTNGPNAANGSGFGAMSSAIGGATEFLSAATFFGDEENALDKFKNVAFRAMHEQKVDDELKNLRQENEKLKQATLSMDQELKDLQFAMDINIEDRERVLAFKTKKIDELLAKIRDVEAQNAALIMCLSDSTTISNSAAGCNTGTANTGNNSTGSAMANVTGSGGNTNGGGESNANGVNGSNGNGSSGAGSCGAGNSTGANDSNGGATGSAGNSNNGGSSSSTNATTSGVVSNATASGSSNSTGSTNQSTTAAKPLYHALAFCKEQEYKQLYEEKLGEVQTLRLQLFTQQNLMNEMQNWQSIKQDMETRLQQLDKQLAKEVDLNKEQKDHYQRNLLQEKERHHQELMVELSNCKQQMANEILNQLDSTTKRTIVENERLQLEIVYQSEFLTSLLKQQNVLQTNSKQDTYEKQILEEMVQQMTQKMHFYEQFIKKMKQQQQQLQVQQQQFQQLLQQQMPMSPGSCASPAPMLSGTSRQLSSLFRQASQANLASRDAQVGARDQLASSAFNGDQVLDQSQAPKSNFLVATSPTAGASNTASFPRRRFQALESQRNIGKQVVARKATTNQLDVVQVCLSPQDSVRSKTTKRNSSHFLTSNKQVEAAATLQAGGAQEPETRNDPETNINSGMTTMAKVCEELEDHLQKRFVVSKQIDSMVQYHHYLSVSNCGLFWSHDLKVLTRRVWVGGDERQPPKEDQTTSKHKPFHFPRRMRAKEEYLPIKYHQLRVPATHETAQTADMVYHQFVHENALKTHAPKASDSDLSILPTLTIAAPNVSKEEAAKMWNAKVSTPQSARF